jgi:hypothetical protein
MPVP